MKFNELVEIVGESPFFETGLLLTGCVDPIDVRRQLSRWVQTGRIFQLRRGLYTLAPPYQKVIPHPFAIANELVHGSYVSCQSALAFYGLIPEGVPQTISVCRGRPNHWHTPFGEFWFHHLADRLMTAYRMVDLPGYNKVFVATPEKALLDLIHLQPAGDNPVYLQELRLQNVEILDLQQLQTMAEKSNSPKLIRAAQIIFTLAQEEHQAYESVSD